MEASLQLWQHFSDCHSFVIGGFLIFFPSLFGWPQENAWQMCLSELNRYNWISKVATAVGQKGETSAWQQQLENVSLIIYQCRKFIEIDFRPCETFAFPVSAEPLLFMFAWIACAVVAFMQIYSKYIIQHAYLSLLHFPCTEGNLCFWLIKRVKVIEIPNWMWRSFFFHCAAKPKSDP